MSIAQCRSGLQTAFLGSALIGLALAAPAPAQPPAPPRHLIALTEPALAPEPVPRFRLQPCAAAPDLPTLALHDLTLTPEAPPGPGQIPLPTPEPLCLVPEGETEAVLQTHLLRRAVHYLQAIAESLKGRMTGGGQ